MPHAFSFTLRVEGQPDVLLTGELSDEEHMLFTSYLQQCEDLEASKPLREGIECRVELRWSQETPMRAETCLPDPDTLGILLHRLRPFILKNEAANFHSVCSLIGRRVPDSRVRQVLRHEKRRYDGRRFQNVVRVRLNDTVVNSELLLNEWLNACEYHRDVHKRKAIEELFRDTPENFTRGILIMMILDKVKAIRNVASLARVLLTPGEKAEFMIPLPEQRDSQCHQDEATEATR